MGEKRVSNPACWMVSTSCACGNKLSCKRGSFFLSCPCRLGRLYQLLFHPSYGLHVLVLFLPSYHLLFVAPIFRASLALESFAFDATFRHGFPADACSDLAHNLHSPTELAPTLKACVSGFQQASLPSGSADFALLTLTFLSECLGSGTCVYNSLNVVYRISSDPWASELSRRDSGSLGYG